jgi:hypothetical protein
MPRQGDPLRRVLHAWFSRTGVRATDIRVGRSFGRDPPAERPACGIEVRATNRQTLNTELMTLGFRCAELPWYGGCGLWHPDCRLGVDVLEDCQELSPAERSNVLTVTLDIAGVDHSAAMAPKLRVVGIEDLITAQTVS